MTDQMFSHISSLNYDYIMAKVGTIFQLPNDFISFMLCLKIGTGSNFMEYISAFFKFTAEGEVEGL